MPLPARFKALGSFSGLSIQRIGRDKRRGEMRIDRRSALLQLDPAVGPGDFPSLVI